MTSLAFLFNRSDFHKATPHLTDGFVFTKVSGKGIQSRSSNRRVPSEPRLSSQLWPIPVAWLPRGFERGEEGISSPLPGSCLAPVWRLPGNTLPQSRCLGNASSCLWWRHSFRCSTLEVAASRWQWYPVGGGVFLSLASRPQHYELTMASSWRWHLIFVATTMWVG